MGSVNAKVLQDADCAVWTAAHTEDPTTAEHVAWVAAPFCALSMWRRRVRLIRYAVGLASVYRAKLRLVHAAGAPEIQSDSPRDGEFRRHLFEWTRERIAVLPRQSGTDLKVCLEGGSASGAVRGSAAQSRLGRDRTGEGAEILRQPSLKLVRNHLRVALPGSQGLGKVTGPRHQFPSG